MLVFTYTHTHTSTCLGPGTPYKGAHFVDGELDPSREETNGDLSKMVMVLNLGDPLGQRKSGPPFFLVCGAAYIGN